MTGRPHTPNQIAAAFRTIADQLAGMPDPDVPLGGQFGPTVTVWIQPRTPDEVDAFARALFGQPGQADRLRTGWQHTTHRLHHPTRLEVAVFVGVEDPAVTQLRAERDALVGALAQRVRAELVATGAVDE